MARKNKNARSRCGRRPLNIKLGRTPRYMSHNKIPTAVSEKRETETMNPMRGEIWFARMGEHYDTCVQSGCRPVLVISNNIGNRHSQTVTVVPMTSRIKRMDLPTHVQVNPADYTLHDGCSMIPSIVLAEQITTIGKNALLHRVATIKNEVRMAEIDAAVQAQLDLAFGRMKREGGNRTW